MPARRCGDGSGGSARFWFWVRAWPCLSQSGAGCEGQLPSIHGLATYMDWLADGMVAVRHVRDGYSSLFSGRNNPLDEAGAGRGDKSRGGDAGCDGPSAKGGTRSEERRVGKEWVSTLSTRWAP